MDDKIQVEQAQPPVGATGTAPNGVRPAGAQGCAPDRANDVQTPADGVALASKVNRGRFQKGDKRINREGRPRGTKVEGPPTPSQYDTQLRASQTDRLMKVAFTTDMVCETLLPLGTRYVFADMPRDVKIVDMKAYELLAAITKATS